MNFTNPMTLHLLASNNVSKKSTLQYVTVCASVERVREKQF